MHPDNCGSALKSQAALKDAFGHQTLFVRIIGEPYQPVVPEVFPQQFSQSSPGVGGRVRQVLRYRAHGIVLAVQGEMITGLPIHAFN